MGEYIDRDGLINDLKDLPEQERIEYMGIYDCIKSTTTADVTEVRHGKWIRPNVPNTRSYKWQCSECGQIAYWLHYGNRGSKNIICKFGYCPNCGAKMDGDTK